MKNVHPKFYPGYNVVMKDDQGLVYYSPCVQDESLTIRCCYSIGRVPSTKTIVVRCKRDATDKERALVEKAVATGQVRRILYAAERIGGLFRKRRKDGTHIIYGNFGRALSDPLIDLELEMLIDSHTTHTLEATI